MCRIRVSVSNLSGLAITKRRICVDNRRYTGRERRQRMLLRLSVVLWVAACCLALCGKAAGAGL